MIYRMFIDDERFPVEGDTAIVVRSSDEAKTVMEKQGCPSFISFDHDLGGADTSMELIHWMIRQDLDLLAHGFIFIPNDFKFDVHSQNPIGAKNIAGLLNSYLQFRNSENGNICT